MNVPTYNFAICSDTYNQCKLSKIEPQSFLPKKSEEKSSGWDVRCAATDGVVLVPNKYVKIPLGIQMIAPAGWWLELRPRSSTFIKKHIHGLYGVLDESYEGILYFCGQYIPDENETFSRNNYPRIEFGDKVGQLLPVKRQEMVVKEVSNEEFSKMVEERGFSRGSGGFGSTG